jgi:hypothetical protein
MDKKLLLETAGQLKQVSAINANEYYQKADHLTIRMNTMMLERKDIEDLIGKNNINMMKDNHANHIRFIASILKNHNPEVLVETILWVFRAYRSHGFSTNYWAAQLNGWMIIIKETLTPDCYKEVYPYYEWIQINIPIFVKVSDEKLEVQNSLH